MDSPLSAAMNGHRVNLGDRLRATKWVARWLLVGLKTIPRGFCSLPTSYSSPAAIFPTIAFFRQNLDPAHDDVVMALKMENRDTAITENPFDGRSAFVRQNRLAAISTRRVRIISGLSWSRTNAAPSQSIVAVHSTLRVSQCRPKQVTPPGQNESRAMARAKSLKASAVLPSCR